MLRCGGGASYPPTPPAPWAAPHPSRVSCPAGCRPCPGEGWRTSIQVLAVREEAPSFSPGNSAGLRWLRLPEGKSHTQGQGGLLALYWSLEKSGPGLPDEEEGRGCSPGFSTSRLSCVSAAPGSPWPPSPPPPVSLNGARRFFLEHLPPRCPWDHPSTSQGRCRPPWENQVWG